MIATLLYISVALLFLSIFEIVVIKSGDELLNELGPFVTPLAVQSGVLLLSIVWPFTLLLAIRRIVQRRVQ